MKNRLSFFVFSKTGCGVFKISAFFAGFSAFVVRLKVNADDSILAGKRTIEGSACKRRKDGEMRYRKNVGKIGEQLAADMLSNNGYRVIARNYAAIDGEIDIIAIKDGVMHFVEVKTRTSDEFGFPADAITETKREHIRKAARSYLSGRRGHWSELSFDVYEVMVNHIENCF